MNYIDIKIGETFSVNGTQYEKTVQGFKRLCDGVIVNEINSEDEIVLENQLING